LRPGREVEAKRTGNRDQVGTTIGEGKSQEVKDERAGEAIRKPEGRGIRRGKEGGNSFALWRWPLVGVYGYSLQRETLWLIKQGPKPFPWVSNEAAENRLQNKLTTSIERKIKAFCQN